MTTAMTTASASASASASATGDLLTIEELESLRLIVDHFEMQARMEAKKLTFGGMSAKQRNELVTELARLQEIKRKLKKMKGIR